MSKLRCPSCGCSKMSVASKAHHDAAGFIIRTLRQCSDCDQVFEPASGRVLSGFVVLLGLFSIVYSWVQFIEYLMPHQIAMLVFQGVLGVSCVIFGVELVRKGVRVFTEQAHSRGA